MPTRAPQCGAHDASTRRGASPPTGYSLRAAFGWAIEDWFYFGREVQAFACNGYDQFRLGTHLTALKMELWEWSLAAGWAEYGDRRSSL